MSTRNGVFDEHLVEALAEFISGKKLPKSEGGHVSFFGG
jgi:hypothetical protein